MNYKLLLAVALYCIIGIEGRPSKGETKGRVPRSPQQMMPPTLKNKVHGRSSRFHEGTEPRGIISPFGKSLGETETLQQEPTFTPYISARVFNMPRFLTHLRGNLESMMGDEEEFGSDENVEYEESMMGGDLDPTEIQIPEPSSLDGMRRWRPAPMGMGGRSRASRMNLLHFVEHPNRHPIINPNRNAYEFGLG